MTGKIKATKTKKMTADATGTEQSQRSKKLIRLDDLIPKKDVKGGRRVLFGARHSGDDSEGSSGR